MFYLGLAVGASIMTTIAILAYECHVRAIKREKTWWRKRAIEYAEETHRLEALRDAGL